MESERCQSTDLGDGHKQRKQHYHMKETSHPATPRIVVVVMCSLTHYQVKRIADQLVEQLWSCSRA